MAACLCRAASGKEPGDGADYPENIIRPAPGWRQTEQSAVAGLTPRSCRHQALASACPGPTVCRLLGEAAGTRLTSPGGPGPGRRKPFQLLLKSEFKKKKRAVRLKKMYKCMYWVVQRFCKIRACLELQNEMLCGNGGLCRGDE